MLPFPFLCPGGPPASKTSDTQLNSAPDDAPLLPECHPMPACGLAAWCWNAHSHRPGAPVAASAPAAGLCPSLCNVPQQTHRAKTCPGGVPSAARRRREAAPRQLKLTPRHRERIPRGNNGAIQKPSGCSCLIRAQRFRFSLCLVFIDQGASKGKYSQSLGAQFPPELT